MNITVGMTLYSRNDDEYTSPVFKKGTVVAKAFDGRYIVEIVESINDHLAAGTLIYRNADVLHNHYTDVVPRTFFKLGSTYKYKHSPSQTEYTITDLYLLDNPSITDRHEAAVAKAVKADRKEYLAILTKVDFNAMKEI